MGSKPKVKTYDPSKYEAKIQTQKDELYDEILNASMDTSKIATDMSREGINDLYESIGLLSGYMGKRRELEDRQTRVSQDARQGLLSAMMNAETKSAKIIDNFMGNYRSMK